MTRYALNPATPVLLRPDGAVQVGWDPRRAMLVRPPSGMTASTLATLLRHLQSGATPADLKNLTPDDVPDSVLADLIGVLVQARVLNTAPPRPDRTAAIRVHGRGPLSDLLVSALRSSRSRVTHSNRSDTGAPRGHDLVVIADYLVADPRMLRELHTESVPHLPVRVRDGVGLVGPLVIPGVTSCLDCADLHRSDRDAAWPAVAAQLRHTVGNADRATVLATAALALNQIDRVIRAVGAGDAARGAEPPPTLDTTLEFDVNVGSVVARRWSRHPRCAC
ncbi:cyclodehydratase [Mycolicibacterium flavescens]|uniref:Cyclodehydratase n=1 Tax=Mycolicibacterium flavescens TaxID=1776 RepID=A0A1E3R9T3_MYCFV|nr:cyclodehydratase [Mycolicibacterium flavescens]MCV7280038.1 cyclodehydratase [Mycolicibacterium flavescens]ODQ86132.1 cyclodehydratase [Mycolicibacterium flavescens]